MLTSDRDLCEAILAKLNGTDLKFFSLASKRCRVLVESQFEIPDSVYESETTCPLCQMKKEEEEEEDARDV